MFGETLREEEKGFTFDGLLSIIQNDGVLCLNSMEHYALWRKNWRADF